ncbi:MAG: glutaredoxin family protein [Euryarchaeota archaeon]|nr:glutaredoxin family protein [Euryarchaeota archaeon]
MNIQHVSGKNKGKIMVYTLSTCIWCKKTKHLFDKMGVEYDYIDVDLLDDAEKEKIVHEQEKWNPLCSYPTVVINDKKCIVGFKEKEIKEALSG